MSVYIIAGLAGRELGGALLRVSDLHLWAQRKRITLPGLTLIDGPEFVQVESLLCAIEHGACDGLTLDAALDIVENDRALSSYEGFTRRPEGEGLDPTMCQWLIGATAHRRWRQLLEDAIQEGELELLDFATRLPMVNPAGAAEPRHGLQPAQVKPVQHSQAQDAAVLAMLRSLGFNPLSLARNPSGRPGIKAKVRAALVGKHNLFQLNSKTFDKTWERLRKAGEIKDA